MTADLVLGIESTAHTIGFSLTREAEVVAMEKATYTTESGGMIPYEVASHHVDKWDDVLQALLGNADVGLEDVDVIAYSQGPGIGHALRIGAAIARGLAVRLDLPLTPVNHCVAHLEIGRSQTQCSDPVLLYVSGANTQVIAYEGGRYRVFGETLDMGVGNFLDSLAREFGFGFPGGPAIEDAAMDSDELLELPYSVKGMDVSLGGLFTHVKRLYHNEGVEVATLCHSVQETVFAMLVEITERALSHTGKSEVVLGGGVACNDRIADMVSSMTRARDAKTHAPANRFLVDNAGMIGVTGGLLSGAGVQTPLAEAGIEPKQRTNDVGVPYR